MKDFFGQELAVGDLVALERPKYRDLTTGSIVSFTPKQVRVAYDVTWGKATIEHTDPRGRKWNEIFLIYPGCLIKAPNQS